MDRARNHRRLMPLAAFAVAMAAGAYGAAPAEAQDGGRYRVLVPALAPEGGVKKNFGEDVAKRLKDQLDDLATHAPVENNTLKDALKRFGLKEEDLTDCIKARQLAVQIGAQLVLCGRYQDTGNGMQVAAEFIAPESGESFEVSQFVAARPDDAAQQISAAFSTYIDQLRVATFCADALGQQSWDEALQQCGRVVEMNPESPSNQYNLASTYLQLERNEEALAGFEKVLELNPVHADALLGAGVVAAKLGRSDDSKRYLNQYLELNPGNIDVRLSIATDVANAGDPAAALTLLEDGMTGDSIGVTVREYAGHFALQAARMAMEGAGPATTDPTQTTSLLEKALGYYDGVYAERGDSTDAGMLANMLVAYRLLERGDEAATFGRRAVQSHPDDAGLWSAYADALAATDQHNEAIEALNRAAQLDPERRVNARLGIWQLQQGNMQNAIASFRKAVQDGEVPNGDEIARQIFAAGYNGHHKNQRFDTAINYYEAAREFASTSQTTGMVNFFHGYALFQKALEAQKPSTLQSARTSLPMFQEAKRYLDQAGGYTEQAAQRQQLLQNIEQYIAIQQALIERGR